MRALHAAMNWIRQLFRGRAFEREMRAEMESHIEQQATLNRARGMSADESIAAARRDFGNVGNLQEAARDARGTRFIEETKRDIVYGLRALLRTPGFTIVAVLSLALGIGVNTAMLTLGRYVFAPPALSEPNTFVSVRGWYTYDAWRAIALKSELFEKTVVYASMAIAVSGDGTDATKATAQLVSDGYFNMYSGRAQLGRLLVPGEGRDGSGPVAVVLSDNFWRRRFGADSSVIGTTLRLTNGLRVTAVGVAAENFKGSTVRAADIWVPLAARTQLRTFERVDQRSISPFTDAKTQWYSISAQLAPGVSAAQAGVQLRNILRHLPTADSTYASEAGDILQVGGRGMINRNNAAGITLAISATLMVLLIGSANVANLVLARGIDRRREIAVRLSLGASRERLVRQLMTESVVLGAIGGVLALAMSQLILRVLSASEILEPLDAGRETLTRALTPDTFVCVLTFLMAFVSVGASGLGPAMRSTKMDLGRASRDDAAALGSKFTRSRMRSGMVIAQVSLSLMLLITASVLLRSSVYASTSDLGFERKQVIATSVSSTENGYSAAQNLEFGRALQLRAEQYVGAEHVARGSIPIAEMDFVRVNPASVERRTTAIVSASPNYFKVLGIPLLRGRAFADQEARDAAPVAIVSETTAKRYWPTGDVLGQRLVLAAEVWSRAVDSTIVQTGREVVVVGVVRDAQNTGMGQVAPSVVYLPSDTGSILVRATGNAAILSSKLRELARITDRDVMATVRTLDEVIHEQGRVQGAEVTSTYTGILGAFGLLLSSIGIFGVVSYAVSQRTREIGIRMAIGAPQSNVLTMILRQGMMPVFFGIVLGIVGAIAATRTIRSMLFGISAIDPLAYLSAGTVVAAVALFACYLPARRAMRVDPCCALRSD